MFQHLCSRFPRHDGHLVRASSTDEETNKAVCYDCHGVHDILPATAEAQRSSKPICSPPAKQCHPGANENFPDSWTSHSAPRWNTTRWSTGSIFSTPSSFR
jgi:hypothetical protein